MTYHVALEGFSSDFNTAAEIQAWAQRLCNKYALTGEVLKIWKAVRIDGDVRQFNATPTHTVVVGA